MSGDDIDIHRLYTERRSKEWLVERLQSHPDEFAASVDMALSAKVPDGWRAAWIVKHAMKSRDARLQSRIGEIIESIPGKTEGHQRELLRILDRLEIGVDHEGYLFDLCMTLWQDLQNAPGLRVVAFGHIFNVVKEYPELKNEVRIVVQDEYVKTLSPGIKRSVKRMVEQLGL